MSRKHPRQQLRPQPLPPPQMRVTDEKALDVRTIDAFMNNMARMGFGTPSQLEATEYPLTRLTKNYQLMNSLYRSHWVIRRIIDVIPEDMCKNWYAIQGQMNPQDIDRLNRLERKTGVRRKILEGMKWGRLYGGAAAIIMIAGHEGILDQPLDHDMIMPGSFKGLIVVDRWSGIFPQSELVTDPSDPEFGLPKYYQISSDTIPGSLKIHHSRLLRFIGRELPFWERQAEVYWGASEVEHVYDELKKRDNTSWNIANLVFAANLRVLKMADLGTVLAMGNAKAQQDLYNTIQAQNWLMNNFSMYLVDKEDDFETKQYSFGGLSDVYENFMCDLAGSAEIPVTKLFGRSPAGMNATGESDLQNYYDSIEEKQEAYLRPVLDKLLPILCISEFGQIPSDLDYKFNPVKRSTETEKADIASKTTTTVTAAFNSGLVSQKTSLMELRQMSDITGLWSNITDEDIANADATANLPGEGLAEMPNFQLDPNANPSMSNHAESIPPRGSKAEGRDMASMPNGPNFNKPSGGVPTADGDFKESEHPRNEKGQFGGNGGGGGNENKSEKYTENEKSGIINNIEKDLKSIGIKGEVNYPPKPIDTESLSFDEEHINKERKHGVTKQEAISFVKKAKISLTRWKGKFENYYSQDGATFVDVKNNQIKTSFKNEEFDENAKNILEVVRKHVDD